MYEFRDFVWKDSRMKISVPAYDVAAGAVKAERGALERYIDRHPEFLSSLVPVRLLSDAPEIAVRMARAAEKAGVGPMAAVAGTIAQLAAERASEAGSEVSIVENGGDIFFSKIDDEIVTGLYAGGGRKSFPLAFRILENDLPLALCSSSGVMGHSLSFGRADLVTIASSDGSTADAVATAAGNLVRSADDIGRTLEFASSVLGVRGVIVVVDGRVGMAGRLPELVKIDPWSAEFKVTRFDA